MANNTGKLLNYRYCLPSRHKWRLYKLNEITTGDLYMKTIFKKLAIGASLAVSVSAIASAPAHAGSLTGATMGGTAASDYLVYNSDATNTFLAPNTPVQKVLDGDATNPGGNVELRAGSEKAGFDFTKNTTLTGQIGGKNITLSSLTAGDWAQGFTQKWLGEALTANGFSLSTNQVGFLSGIFENYGGRQRFSDPNISYVNQNDNTGLISIGLAGHFNATSLLTSSISGYIADTRTSALNKSLAQGLLGVLGTKEIQASEIVKVSYNGGPDQLLYSFNATASGLTEKLDGISHSGNYEVTIDGIPPKAVPEPSVMLGLLGVAGVFASQRKLKLRKA
jgi:hypothetical protein